ncbi:MAG: hypothetical protein N2C12_10515, partial [Planctomycetales bacterium]
KFGRTSMVIKILRDKNTLSVIQKQLPRAFYAIACVWLILSIFALIKTDFAWQKLFFPWMTGHRAQPWGRDRIGGGIDFLYALAGYLNIFCLAVFGITAALARNGRVRTLAIILLFLSWPIVLMGRTRNTMLAIAMPAILSFGFLRMRRRPIARILLLLLAFLATEAWFSGVMNRRGGQKNNFHSMHVIKKKEKTHLGLNMYMELCWINTLFNDGTLQPNWGYRYFADAVNPIPRSIWPGKPLIGVDYAIARGFGGGKKSSGGILASISTGMIGQGVVNFGTILGPMAAALLISVWVAILARFDLTSKQTGRLLLYLMGVVLTFNLGRDISLLVAYPLIFGYIIIRIAERRSQSRQRRVRSHRPRTDISIGSRSIATTEC